MLPLRLAKITCDAGLALYAGVVAFGNVADYWTNFAFVTHVLDMDLSNPLILDETESAGESRALA